jgi:lysozyme
VVSVDVIGPDVPAAPGEVNWARVRAAGASFAIVRASSGIEAPELTARHWQAMRAAAIVRGVYHLAALNADPPDPCAEVRSFDSTVARAGGLVAGDLPPVLAVLSTPLSAAETLAWTGAALAELERLTGVQPILHTSAALWIDQLGDPRVSFGCLLWISDPDVPRPRVPRAWSHWTLWRYVAVAAVDGIDCPCGLSRLNSHEQLDRLRRR